jgi:glycosyltransferase involved in cell wall biosynthesis
MYNEVDGIGACLDALLGQTRALDEIIVVDNGSTDGSALAVEEYVERNPSIRIVYEDRPGCYAARTAGYDAATSDVIARVDADTWADPGWAAAIESFFNDEENSQYSALTGPTTVHDGPPFAFIEKQARKVPKGFEKGGPIGAVHGLNHAITSTAWSRVRGTLTERADVWEDMDLSLAMEEQGMKIFFLPTMFVATSTRTIQRSPWTNRHYVTGGIRTARARGNRRRERQMYLDLVVRIIVFTVMWLIFRPWDPERQKWRPVRLVQRLPVEVADVTVERRRT